LPDDESVFGASFFILPVLGHGHDERRGPSRRCGDWVLRKNRLPAILVECGFLTNPAEAARISDSGSRESLARAIGEAIVRYD